MSAEAALEYRVWGVGQASCNQYVAAFERGEVDSFKHYMAGYLTGFSMASDHKPGRLFAARPTPELLASLRSHCANHRMDSFERALQALLLAAQKDAETEAPTTGTWGRPPSTKGGN